ncbi:MAG: sugar phosphate isomerase/epimerase [Lentisphaerae bacterium]|nr:sugar phosphate isomerase/epimerase [Lentisphaerota bacterium]
MQIGTLLRCAHIDERRIAFFQEIGLDCIQIAGVFENLLAPTAEAAKASDALFELLREYNISVPTMFLSYPNQNWANPKEGIGVVPAATRAERMLISCRLMEWCKRYDINSVSCHVGFVPEEKNEFYERFILDMQQLARFAAALGQEFLFETGTETAAHLKMTLDDINEPNVGINFDPANMLIYNNGDPAGVVDLLGDKIKVIHCKDANPPVDAAPMGKETVLGEGSTNFTALLKRLVSGGFNGPLIIEREILPGPEQEKDIQEAVALIKSTIKGVK